MTNFELTNAICEEIRREYRVPSIPFSLEEGEPSLTGSKVGGIPYLPKGAKWPADEKGAPCNFWLKSTVPSSPLCPTTLTRGCCNFSSGRMRCSAVISGP